MQHLGDITKIRGYSVPITDCVIGGSPCQDLSVAGKRAGLAGARSGLFMEQIRIVKEMLDADRKSGRTGQLIRPRYMVWENVPGAFSSNGGEDFRAVLEEICRVADETTNVPGPKTGKWDTSGSILGEGWSVAWRVFDAQFWGVPQRRRRIALVADFGGQSAPEILFERVSVSGDSAESGEAGKRITGDAESGVGTAIGVKCLNPSFPQSARVYDADGVWHSLNANENGGQSRDAILYEPKSAFEENWAKSDTKNALRAEASKSSHAIVFDAREPTTYPGVGITSKTNVSNPKPGDPCHTLNTDSRNYVVTDDHQNRVTDYVATFSFGRSDEMQESNVASTQSARQYKCATDLVAAVDCRNGTENPDVNGTLQAKEQGQNLNSNNVVRSNMTVRRLTPLECERLQGYPDGWTDIGAWTDSKGKLHKESSDSARYKALGNSISLPNWKWVLKRLCAFYERDATMASLFDGIGGFPYIWEQLNGKGSCLWASEIEEFPIAVTKFHFQQAVDKHEP